jgi:hypothetical protein
LKKLKTTEIKAFREQLLKEQNNQCGLCEEPLLPEEAVLDHSHKTGRVRRVLHRGCNVLEGVIANNAVRNKITKERLKVICENLPTYLETAEIDLLHPTHKTPEEKKLRAKRRKKRAIKPKP